MVKRKSKPKGASKSGLFARFANGKRKFLEALDKTGFVVDALEAAGVHRLTLDDWRRVDEVFSQRVDDVEAAAKANLTDRLEKETFIRSVAGWAGKEGERKYSPSLQKFMLTAHRPEVYLADSGQGASPEELARRVRFALQALKDNSGVGEPGRGDRNKT